MQLISHLLGGLVRPLLLMLLARGPWARVAAWGAWRGPGLVVCVHCL